MHAASTPVTIARPRKQRPTTGCSRWRIAVSAAANDAPAIIRMALRQSGTDSTRGQTNKPKTRINQSPYSKTPGRIHNQTPATHNLYDSGLADSSMLVVTLPPFNQSRDQHAFDDTDQNTIRGERIISENRDAFFRLCQNFTHGSSLSDELLGYCRAFLAGLPRRRWSAVRCFRWLAETKSDRRFQPLLNDRQPLIDFYEQRE